jgi:acetyl esterase/lipase
MVIVDVDYRLSPEVRFPVALYDSWTAIKWASISFEKSALCFMLTNAP